MSGQDARSAAHTPSRPPLEADDTPIGRDWVEWAKHLEREVERLRDRAVCSGCGRDVNEAGICEYADCDDGEMIPASDLPWALRQMRDQREMWRQEAMSL